MLASEISALVKAVAALLPASVATRAELEATAATFDRGQKFPELIKKLKLQWVGKTQPASAQFVATLASLEAILKAAKAKDAAKDIASLRALLRESASVTQGISSLIQEALDAPLPEKKKKAPASSYSQDELYFMADALIGAAPINEEFDAKLAELSANKKVSAKQIVTIASRVLGYERNYKRKQDAIDALRNWQIQEAIEAGRDRRIQRIAV